MRLCTCKMYFIWWNFTHVIEKSKVWLLLGQCTGWPKKWHSFLVHYDHNLHLVNVPAVFNCDINCYVSSHLHAINIYYENIVAALHCAASIAIHCIPCNTLKTFWNEELDRLKNDSIFWHNLWTDAGKPSSGVVQHTRLACKAKFKLAIRNAYTVFENKLSDENVFPFYK